MLTISVNKEKDKWTIQDWMPPSNENTNIAVTSEGKIYINGELKIDIPNKIFKSL